MELQALVLFALGMAFVVFLIIGTYAAVRRMQGHPTRFDRIYELFALVTGAQRASIYPPSLRGNPDPQVQEDVEVSRSDRAVRSTPSKRRSDKDDA